MAGAHNEHPSLPTRGKVQEVRRQWAVHEDGALAYQIQNEEISEHYGLNRFHRQLVREDIPVAKFVQSEEELRQQEERLRQLEILKAQAEEDARIAKKISRRMKREKTEAISRDECVDVDDEELARLLQEKEKKKYERHIERKKERKLKKDRQMLEEALAKDLEEARLAHNSAENGIDRVSASVESLNLQGVSATRVTSSGRIEDDGDFSDFYNLPDEMDEYTRLEIQATQDEELARLLQEQEHKRTKAKVDPEKLRRIEHRDEQLARIIQEQEKLRLKKAKQKHQARKEAMRQMSVESMPLGTSANSLKQHSPLLSGSLMAASDVGHHRYRSNSYTQACDTTPSPPRTPPPGHLVADGRGQPRAQSDQSLASVPTNIQKSQHYLKNQQSMAEDSPSSIHGRSMGNVSGRGMSTLESARQIAAGNPEGILAIQTSQKTGSGGQKGKSISHQERVITPHDVSNIDITHGQQGNWSRPTREPPDPHRSGAHSYAESAVYSQPYKPHGVPPEFELRHASPVEGRRLLDSRGGGSMGPSHRHNVHQQPQRCGFYTSREEEDHTHETHSGGLAGFNIAAAIDPTYQRRHPEASYIHETQPASHIPYSLPQADGALEWDPNLRGSLRKTKTPIHGYQGSTTTGSLDHRDNLGGQQVLSSWQPVQGQRRRDPGSRGKSQKQNVPGADGKTNCKQQ